MCSMLTQVSSILLILKIALDFMMNQSTDLFHADSNFIHFTDFENSIWFYCESVNSGIFCWPNPAGGWRHILTDVFYLCRTWRRPWESRWYTWYTPGKELGLPWAACGMDLQRYHYPHFRSKYWVDSTDGPILPIVSENMFPNFFCLHFYVNVQTFEANVDLRIVIVQLYQLFQKMCLWRKKISPF